MKVTRRQFLIASGGAGVVTLLPLGLTSAWAQPVPTVAPRIRLEAFAIQPDRLASLKKGVAVMKSRQPSDPTSWFFQAAVHSVRDDEVEAATAKDPLVANIDKKKFWNRCPHGEEFHSADFLIWHRAYLYHFETILRAAAGDPQLSLPYWNYSATDQRRFPRAFAEADADPETEEPRNPLYDRRREQAFANGLYELSEPVVSTKRLFGESNFFGEDESSGLAGGVVDNNPRTRGLIESQPHDLMHFAIGGAIPTHDGKGMTTGLMASVDTAAFDPIFWVHHSNIDRLWTLWDCLPGRAWGKPHLKDWLEETPWNFHGADGQIQTHPRYYYIDRRNLAVRYDSDDPSCRPLSATDPRKAGALTTIGTGALAMSAEVQSFIESAAAGSNDEPVRTGPDESSTQTVSLAIPGGLSPRKNGKLLFEGTLLKPRRLVLELAGLEVEGVTSVGFDVFVNLPAGSPADRDTPNFVGTVALFGSLPGDAHGHGHEHHEGGGTQRFDLSRLAARSGFKTDALTITLVPFDLLRPVGEQPRLRRAAGIRYTSAHVILLEGSNLPIA